MSYQPLNGADSPTGLTPSRTPGGGSDGDHTGMAFEDLIWALPPPFRSDLEAVGTCKGYRFTPSLRGLMGTARRLVRFR